MDRALNTSDSETSPKLTSTLSQKDSQFLLRSQSTLQITGVSLPNCTSNSPKRKRTWTNLNPPKGVGSIFEMS